MAARNQVSLAQPDDIRRTYLPYLPPPFIGVGNYVPQEGASSPITFEARKPVTAKVG